VKRGDFVKITAETPFQTSEFGWDREYWDGRGTYGLILDVFNRDSSPPFVGYMWKVRDLGGKIGLYRQTELKLLAKS